MKERSYENLEDVLLLWLARTGEPGLAARLTARALATVVGETMNGMMRALWRRLDAALGTPEQRGAFLCALPRSEAELLMDVGFAWEGYALRKAAASWGEAGHLRGVGRQTRRSDARGGVNGRAGARPSSLCARPRARGAWRRRGRPRHARRSFRQAGVRSSVARSRCVAGS